MFKIEDLSGNGKIIIETGKHNSSPPSAGNNGIDVIVMKFNAESSDEKGFS